MHKQQPMTTSSLLEEYYAAKKSHFSQQSDAPALPKPKANFPQVMEFLSHCTPASKEQGDGAWDASRLLEKNGMVYYLPDGFLKDTGLRFLRTGLLLGELKKDRFEPSQAFAMALKWGQYANEISFSRQDERVIRYLKGETISLTQEEGEALTSGWCLVCVDQFPLGWAKASGQSLKNKYYAGWRWM